MPGEGHPNRGHTPVDSMCKVKVSPARVAARVAAMLHCSCYTSTTCTTIALFDRIFICNNSSGYTRKISNLRSFPSIIFHVAVRLLRCDIRKYGCNDTMTRATWCYAVCTVVDRVNDEPCDASDASDTSNLILA